MSIKKKIIEAYYNRPPFDAIGFTSDVPVDKEIEPFLLTLNRRNGISTIISCAGHSKEEKNADADYNPYLAFVVNEVGWRLFWEGCLPEITMKLALLVYMPVTDKSCAIMIRAENYSDKKVFWDIVPQTLLKYFNKSRK